MTKARRAPRAGIEAGTDHRTLNLGVKIDQATRERLYAEKGASGESFEAITIKALNRYLDQRERQRAAAHN